MNNESLLPVAGGYLDTYVKQAKMEARRVSNPAWMKSFFTEFSTKLQRRKDEERRSIGDRYIVTRPFAEAFGHLLPAGAKWDTEQPLSKYVSETDIKRFPLLKRKRVDFSVRRGEALLLIEFKTNLSFNDISAAIAEMHLVKKYATSNRLHTAVLFLYPASGNIDMFIELNKIMGSALDAIWVLGRGTKASYMYDLKAFEKMHDDINNFLL